MYIYQVRAIIPKPDNPKLILFVQHKVDGEKTYFDLPGGILEPGEITDNETTKRVLLAKIHEETRYQVRPDIELITWGTYLVDGQQIITLLYKAEIVSNQLRDFPNAHPQTLPKELFSPVWVTQTMSFSY